MHHKNITVFFLVQNLSKHCRSLQDVAINCQIVILFKSPRDTQQIKVLARQTGMKHLEMASIEAIMVRFGYLIINMQPSVPDIPRLRSGLFDAHRKVYILK